MKKIRGMMSVVLVFTLLMGVIGVFESNPQSKAAIVDAIPLQIGEVTQGQFSKGSQDGEHIYYSFTTTNEKAFYVVSFNSNEGERWKVTSQPDWDETISDRAGTDYWDCGELKKNTTYYVIVDYWEKNDAVFRIRVDKYVDDVGDDAFSSTEVKADTMCTYALQNGSDKDCFSFITGDIDYNFSISAGDNIQFNIYSDDLLTTPFWGEDYSNSKTGTDSINLTGTLDKNRKYWIVFESHGGWGANQDPDTYTFRFESLVDISSPYVSLSAKKGRKVKLTWNAVSNADGYRVYRSVGGDSSFKLVKTVKANGKREYISKKQKKKKFYYYMVKAYRTYNGKEYISIDSNHVSKSF